MSDFLKSTKTKAVLWIISAIVIVLLVFGFGIVVGYHRAIFASEFGENYYHNFSGGLRGGLVPPGTMMGESLGMHGVSGVVLDTASTTISIKDSTGNEDSVEVTDNTPIKEMNDRITIADIEVGEGITVIGEPNAAGQIQARFIRIFEAPPSSLSKP